MNLELTNRVEMIVGEKVTTLAELNGGMISDVVKLSFDHAPPLVAKITSNGGKSGDNGHDLSLEGYMLSYLKENSALPVPSVLHSEPDLLLISFIEGSTGINQSVQAHAGEILSTLHQVTSDTFGLERDTLIGPIHQPNPPTSSWIEFFREHRMLYMAQVALDSGNLPRSIFQRIQKLADNLHQFLIEPEQAVLIHGDMWTTNILSQDGKITGIIDPACYYSHNEMELAYTTLFGTFGQPFFDSYRQHIPVDGAFFDTRRHIYNLYPLLVHVTLFAGGYARSVDITLQQFGF